MGYNSSNQSTRLRSLRRTTVGYVITGDRPGTRLMNPGFGGARPRDSYLTICRTPRRRFVALTGKRSSQNDTVFASDIGGNCRLFDELSGQAEINQV
ncbi:hypothetical protein [Haloglycomyces albus]|uniref:hypothetical protein n=1 Tax=Haloglycomyces albus TaxID=526067 RepID=UPI0005504B17|nr:hypothetical protein [Haloglycomyces albus]